MTERDDWITLAAVNGVGESTFHALLTAYRNASAVLEAARTGQLRAATAAQRRWSGRLLPVDVVDAAENAARSPELVHERIRSLGLWTWTPLDADFPARLRVLDPPPAVLFGLGERDALTRNRSVAIVGTRRPTHHGRATAARLAARLVEHGAVVVSGLAIGVDGAAQAAAVEHDGCTVGVLGSGHAMAGPRAHRELMRRMVRRGAVISELAPDSVPTRGTFPRRNRIISALADGIVVVEAPARSGALITARHALEQGRELFVVPGRLDDRTAAGCLALLRETPARIVAGVDELLADLGYAGTGEPATGPDPLPDRATPLPLDRATALRLLGTAERAVAAAICEDPDGLDALVMRTGMSPGVVAGAVTLLQLRGWIQMSGAAFLPAGPLVVTR